MDNFTVLPPFNTLWPLLVTSALKAPIMWICTIYHLERRRLLVDVLEQTGTPPAGTYFVMAIRWSPRSDVDFCRYNS